MTQKKTNTSSNTVSIIKWCASEPGAYCTGIYGVYNDNETAEHDLKVERESLVQKGYTIIKRTRKEAILKNTDDNSTMMLFIDTYPIKR